MSVLDDGFLLDYAWGAEDDPPGEEEPTAPEAAAESLEDEAEEMDTEISSAEIKKLRKEHQSLRRRLKEAEDKNLSYEREKLTEKEQLEIAKKELEEQLAAATQSLGHLHVEYAVRDVARSMNFYDPTDAVNLLNLTDIKLLEDGRPDGRSVSKALEALAKSKPHLVRPVTPGSGDVRGGTPPPTTPPTDQAIAEHQANQQRRLGRMVRLPS